MKEWASWWAWPPAAIPPAEVSDQTLILKCLDAALGAWSWWGGVRGGAWGRAWTASTCCERATTSNALVPYGGSAGGSLATTGSGCVLPCTYGTTHSCTLEGGWERAPWLPPRPPLPRGPQGDRTWALR